MTSSVSADDIFLHVLLYKMHLLFTFLIAPIAGVINVFLSLLLKVFKVRKM